VNIILIMRNKIYKIRGSIMTIQQINSLRPGNQTPYFTPQYDLSSDEDSSITDCSSQCDFSSDEDQTSDVDEQSFSTNIHTAETTPEIFLIDDQKLALIFCYFLLTQRRSTLLSTEMPDTDLSQAVTSDTLASQLVQGIRDFLNCSTHEKLTSLRHFVSQQSTGGILRRYFADFFHGNNAVLEIAGETFFEHMITLTGVEGAAIMLSALLNLAATNPSLNTLILSDLPTELLNHPLVIAAKQQLQEANIQIYEATTQKHIFTEGNYANFFNMYADRTGLQETSDTALALREPRPGAFSYSRFFADANDRETPQSPENNRLTPI
jgi:hypothetical protein